MNQHQVFLYMKELDQAFGLVLLNFSMAWNFHPHPHPQPNPIAQNLWSEVMSYTMKWL